MRYYFDTCIWRDFYENRYGPKGRPLGIIAGRLTAKIMNKKHQICYSDLIIKELKTEYSEDKISDMLTVLMLSKRLRKIEITREDYAKAREIAKIKPVPLSDIIHAILAKKVGAILVSQDNHYSLLRNLVNFKKPEELI